MTVQPLSTGMMVQCQIEVRNQQLATVLVFRYDAECAEVSSDHTFLVQSTRTPKSSAARTTFNFRVLVMHLPSSGLDGPWCV